MSSRISPEDYKSSPRICIIGAGLSGLCIAVKLKTELNQTSFVIYENNEDVGGNWLVNSYPGCCCDIPSHLYSFSFAPKYDWSHAYAKQGEILEYIKQVTTEFDIYPFIRFQTQVKSLSWNGDRSEWDVLILDSRTNQTQEQTFDIVINGTGKLHAPYYPEEYLNFQGDLIHSAEWDHSVSLSGKRVGIVGTGASAVQIITAIASKVEHLYVFQRNAPYILPKVQLKIPEIVKWAFSNTPGLYKLTRLSLFLFHELLHGVTKHKSWQHKLGNKLGYWYRRLQISSAELIKKTRPNYGIAHKRILLSQTYYPTLQRKNVTLITDKIVEVKGNCVKTGNENVYQLDVLILATGFKPQEYFAPMTIKGLNGVDVLQEWKRSRPIAYMGILSSDMPNLFTILGPYTQVGHNSQIFNIECQADWVVKAIKRLIGMKARVISVKKEAEEGFMQYLNDSFKSTVWANETCNSWYLSNSGEITMMWPNNQIEFWKRCEDLDECVLEFS